MMTGGDPISARFMRQDFFTYDPQFKLMISGNNKPGLRSIDEAIKARVKLLPFSVFIPVGERDLELKNKLKAEWPGILQWMIDGCLHWQRVGLKPPTIVIEATNKYLEEEDTISLWLDDVFVKDKQRWTSVSTLNASWKEWATETTSSSFRRAVCCSGSRQSKALSALRAEREMMSADLKVLS